MSVSELKTDLLHLRFVLLKETESKTQKRSAILSINSDSKPNAVFNAFTFKNAGKQVRLDLFQNDAESLEGFRVKEAECWNKFTEMMNTERQVAVDLNLN